MNAKLLTHREKVKKMPDHPRHNRLQDLTKNRLKRTSLNHVMKEQQRKQSDILAPRPEECEMFAHIRTPLVLKAEVKLSITCISTKSSDSEASLKTLTLAELDKSYPATAWTQIFTDVSAENATRRMWHLHQTAKQATHYYSNTGWRYVLKLQSRSTGTPHRDRDCLPAEDKTKEGCAPHRLPICTAITRIRKSSRLHLTKFKTKFKQPYFN